MKRMLVGIAAAALGALVVALPASSAVDMTPAEASELQFMREEEKLARDVYTVLAKEWSEATVFARIARSEQRHMDAVMVVLDRYGITDPAIGAKQGEFTDAGLQTLYDQLVAEGSKSAAAALGVGVKIERADIADLEEALAATSNVDLERLYGNLLRASKNHLRAFQANADGKPARAGQGREPRFGQGMGQGAAGTRMGLGARRGQGNHLHNGTCIGDGSQAGREQGWRAGGGW